MLLLLHCASTCLGNKWQAQTPTALLCCSFQNLPQNHETALFHRKKLGVISNFADVALLVVLSPDSQNKPWKLGTLTSLCILSIVAWLYFKPIEIKRILSTTVKMSQTKWQFYYNRQMKCMHIPKYCPYKGDKQKIFRKQTNKHSCSKLATQAVSRTKLGAGSTLVIDQCVTMIGTNSC